MRHPLIFLTVLLLVLAGALCAPIAFTASRIIGNDDREPVTATYSDQPLVGLIETRFASGKSYACTATALTRRWLITAGHCVRRAQDAKQESGRASERGWAKSISFFPQQQSQTTRPFARREVSRILLAKPYWGRVMGESFGVPQNVDYALLYLDQPLGKAPNLILSEPGSQATSLSAYSYGDITSSQTLYRQEACTLKRVVNSMRHQCDSGAGSSGAPLVRRSARLGKPRFEMLGMHTGSVPGEDNVSAQFDAAGIDLIRIVLDGTVPQDSFLRRDLNPTAYFALSLGNNCSSTLTMTMADRTKDRRSFRVLGERKIAGYETKVDAFRTESPVVFLGAVDDRGRSIKLGPSPIGQVETGGVKVRLYRFSLAGGRRDQTLDLRCDVN